MDNLPADSILHILEYRSTIPYGFDASVKIGIHNGLPIDKAIKLAYRIHDPSKDKYSIITYLGKLKEDVKHQSSDKDKAQNSLKALKEKMATNPKLNRILSWYGSFDPTPQNLESAFREGNPVMVEYFFVKGVDPKTVKPLLYNGDLEMIKVMMKWGVKPTIADINFSIYYDKFEILEYMIKEVKFTPGKDSLFYGILKGNFEFIQYLVEARGVEVTADHLKSARYYAKNTPKIIEYLDKKLASQTKFQS